MTKRQMPKQGKGIERQLGGKFRPYQTIRSFGKLTIGDYGIFRPLDIECLEALGEIAETAQSVIPTFRARTEEATGVTILGQQTIRNIRKQAGSKLGQSSYIFARERIRGMLPPTAGKALDITLGRFIIAKPNNGARQVLATLTEPVLIQERKAVESGIDAVEGVRYPWERFLPHIRIGQVLARQPDDSVKALEAHLTNEYMGTAMRLESVAE